MYLYTCVAGLSIRTWLALLVLPEYLPPYLGMKCRPTCRAGAAGDVLSDAESTSRDLAWQLGLFCQPARLPVGTTGLSVHPFYEYLRVHTYLVRTRTLTVRPDLTPRKSTSIDLSFLSLGFQHARIPCPSAVSVTPPPP